MEKRIEGCGSIAARLRLEGGRIQELRFFGDFFSLCDPEKLAARFIGLRPTREDYRPALANVEVGQYFTNLNADALLELLSC